MAKVKNRPRVTSGITNENERNYYLNLSKDSSVGKGVEVRTKEDLIEYTNKVSTLSYTVHVLNNFINRCYNPDKVATELEKEIITNFKQQFPNHNDWDDALKTYHNKLTDLLRPMHS